MCWRVLGGKNPQMSPWGVGPEQARAPGPYLPTGGQREKGEEKEAGVKRGFATGTPGVLHGE